MNPWYLGIGAGVLVLLLGTRRVASADDLRRGLPRRVPRYPLRVLAQPGATRVGHEPRRDHWRRLGATSGLVGVARLGARRLQQAQGHHLLPRRPARPGDQRAVSLRDPAPDRYLLRAQLPPGVSQPELARSAGR